MSVGCMMLLWLCMVPSRAPRETQSVDHEPRKRTLLRWSGVVLRRTYDVLLPVSPRFSPTRIFSGAPDIRCRDRGRRRGL